MGGGGDIATTDVEPTSSPVFAVGGEDVTFKYASNPGCLDVYRCQQKDDLSIFNEPTFWIIIPLMVGAVVLFFFGSSLWKCCKRCCNKYQKAKKDAEPMKAVGVKVEFRTNNNDTKTGGKGKGACLEWGYRGLLARSLGVYGWVG